MIIKAAKQNVAGEGNRKTDLQIQNEKLLGGFRVHSWAWVFGLFYCSHLNTGPTVCVSHSVLSDSLRPCGL